MQSARSLTASNARCDRFPGRSSRLSTSRCSSTSSARCTKGSCDPPYFRLTSQDQFCRDSPNVCPLRGGKLVLVVQRVMESYSLPNMPKVFARLSRFLAFRNATRDQLRQRKSIEPTSSKKIHTMHILLPFSRIFDSLVDAPL